ncbi:MAG: class I tRNA ligase family protein, partial [Alphaproteobacteria bacterium]|nr:class I tRNA ligase family protein [Alphaproteobacteria bacterium]
HHENEIAQSCCGNNTETYANYWVHNGHLIVNGEKMSKSLGNFFTVKEVLEKAQGEAIRFCLISTHYRQPLNWTDKALEQAKSAMDRFYTALRNVENIKAEKVEIPQNVMEALKDDVNTPLAISHMHEIVSELNKCKNDAEKALQKGKLLASGGLLGLFKENPEEWFKGKITFSDTVTIQDHFHIELTDSNGKVIQVRDSKTDALMVERAKIDALIAERVEVRKAKNFARADEIRDKLKVLNVVLEDTPSGTIWKYGK